MRSAWTQEVLEPGFLKGLDQLVLARRRSRRGAYGASPSATARASGLDWADHRPYEAGDDLRYIDWHLYARIGKPYVRRFLSERAERLDLLVDASRSMTIGAPEKGSVACALAFVFAYVALSAGERVGAHFFGDRILASLPAHRGPVQVAQLIGFLRKAPCGVGTDVGASLSEFAAGAKEVGRAVVISDLLDPAFAVGLSALRRRGFEVGAVRLRSSADEAPDLPDGGAVVIDIETGARRRIVFSADTRERYRHLRHDESEKTAALCAQAGICLARLGTQGSLADLVFCDLRRSGLLD